MTSPKAYNEDAIKLRYGALPPSEEILISYFKAIKLIAAADGEVAPEELAALRNGMQLLGVSDKGRDEIENFHPRGKKLEDVLKVNKGGRLARFLLRDAVEISSADGHYSKQERAAMERVAEHLGISKNTLLSIEAYVEGERSLRHLRDALFR